MTNTIKSRSERTTHSLFVLSNRSLTRHGSRRKTRALVDKSSLSVELERDMMQAFTLDA